MASRLNQPHGRWFPAVFLFSSLIFNSVALAATPREIEQAIAKAKSFLYNQQKDGTWEEVPAPESPSGSSVQGGQWGGLTAITTYALLAAGESPQDPRLVEAIKFLKSADLIGTYAVAMRCQVWNLIPLDAEVRAAIKKDAAFLFAARRQDGTTKGLYPYTLKSSAGNRGDHSISQYAVLGMWALAQTGFEIPMSYWQETEATWISHQDKETGGWAYPTYPSDANPVTASMTAAGVATLFITQDYLHAGGRADAKGNIPNPPIDAGLKWISENFDKVYNSNYTLYGIERIGVASGYKYFGGIDWYAAGADHLVKTQNDDGGWKGKSIPDACFALLFLVRGRAPVILNKLDYSAGSIQPKPWNQRPRDAANLAKWIGKQIERELNWQIVNLNVATDDLHDAPILYISGDKVLNFSDQEQQKLRQYIEQGGLILGNADGGSQAFAESFRKLGEKLFPRYKFRELPANHPIYIAQQFDRDKWRIRLSTSGLSNGARELMLLIPDAAEAWQLRDPHKAEFFQLPANIFLYATDKRNLRYKGETYLVKADEKTATDRALKLARLQYNGNWDPEPGGWRRLAAVMRNENRLDLQINSVKLEQGSLAEYRIAHLTGTLPFQLDESARNEIRAFVERGGTLLIDAAGGSSRFADAAEKELQAIFGPIANALADPIPSSHPLYSAGGKLDRIEYRQFARKTLSADQKTPRIRGIEINGRMAVFFSREDLSVGLVGQPVDGIYGYEPQSATTLMSKMLSYSDNKVDNSKAE